MASSAYGIGVTCSCFLLSKVKHAQSVARAVANWGRIPIARGLLAGRAPFGPHLGSDPYWRVDADGGLEANAILSRELRPAAQSLVLLRNRCVTQRKAPQLSAPSAVATGTCGARFGRGLAKLAGAQTDASPDPPKAVLLGAYRWGPRGAGSARLRRASRLWRECTHPSPTPPAQEVTKRALRAVSFERQMPTQRVPQDFDGL